MKIVNLFKKSSPKTKKTAAETLNKQQLEKVMGGTETKPLVSIQDETKSFSSIIR